MIMKMKGKMEMMMIMIIMMMMMEMMEMIPIEMKSIWRRPELKFIKDIIPVI